MGTNDNQNNRRASKAWKFTAWVPPGDHTEVTKHLTESAVNKLAATVREILMAVEVHGDMAPTTATMVRELCTAVKDETMTWVRRWPK